MSKGPWLKGAVLASLLGAVLASCAKAPPPVVLVDAQKARLLADQAANDLVRNNVKDLYSLLDSGFESMISGPADLEKVLAKMDSNYGRPLEWAFKISNAGYRVDGTWKRPKRTYYYAVRTSKYAMGKYFLRIEVVPSFKGDRIDISGFGIFDFKDGTVPSYLR
jgi:hypothetical protein